MEQEFGPLSGFEVREPAVHRIPFVFNSPHSGRVYPSSFLGQSRLDAHTIRRSEDHFVDELYARAPSFGAPLLVAHFPRAFLDVNREPYELDPRMFDGPLPAHANTASLRVAGGLGTVPKIVAENLDIYAGRLPVEEALTRVERYYKPYHLCLRRLLSRTHSLFGFCVLIDCHSMPGSIRLAGSNLRPDFIVGDRFGASASPALSNAAMTILEDLGFRAVRNKPYAGGFITEHYGRPRRGLHALQIEVNRALYIDEVTLEKRPDFAVLEGLIGMFMQRMADFTDSLSSEASLAAE